VIERTAWVSDSAQVSDSARVFGSAWVFGSARVSGSALVSGSAWVSDSARVYGSAPVSGSALVCGSAHVSGSALVGLHARIRNTRHHLVIGPIGSRDDMLTAWRDRDGIGVSTGCFTGLIDEFESKVDEKHGASHEYHDAIALIRRRAATWEPITDDERRDVAPIGGVA